MMDFLKGFWEKHNRQILTAVENAGLFMLLAVLDAALLSLNGETPDWIDPVFITVGATALSGIIQAVRKKLAARGINDETEE